MHQMNEWLKLKLLWFLAWSVKKDLEIFDIIIITFIFASIKHSNNSNEEKDSVSEKLHLCWTCLHFYKHSIMLTNFKKDYSYSILFMCSKKNENHWLSQA